MKRIVLTVAVGKNKYAEMAMGLARSLNLIGDDTPRVVITDNRAYDWGRYFSQVLEPTDSLDDIYFTKYTALERTDADQVLFIDSDCLAFKRLDDIFQYCQGSPVAVPGIPRSEGVWYGKSLSELCATYGVAKIPYINTGVVYYERGDDAKAVFREARELKSRYQSLGFDDFRGKVPDEPCLSLAMATSGKGKVVPVDMNFSHSAVGLVGKLRMDVLKGECKYICRSHSMRLVEPYIFHAHYFSKFLLYWRELDKLEWLELYEDRHKPRYMHRFWKIRRSFERRILELRDKA